MQEVAISADAEKASEPTESAMPAHPRAGQEMTGAEMVIEVLAQEGVDTVFGYSGGAILPTYDAIFRYNERERGEAADDPMRLVVPANEQGAGFMAAGYARSSGKVGVFLVTSGPGATNTVTPIRDCMADSVPVVLITGQVARSAMGTDAFQEAPIVNIMGNCAKHVFLVTRPEQLEETIRTAFEVARSGRPGPVVVDLPKDVQNWVGEFKGSGLLGIRGYRQRMEALRQSRVSERKARQFFDMLEQSSRPLLMWVVEPFMAKVPRPFPPLPANMAFPASARSWAWGRWIPPMICICTCSVCTARPMPTMPLRIVISLSPWALALMTA